MMENARFRSLIQFHSCRRKREVRLRVALGFALLAQASLLTLGLSGCMASAPVPRATASLSEKLGKPIGSKRTLAAAPIEASLAFGKLADGSIQLVDVVAPASFDVSRIRVTFESNSIPLVSSATASDGKQRFQALFGVPFNRKPGPAQVSVALMDDSGKKAIEEATLDFESIDGGYKSEQLKVDDSHINPNARNLRRIERERKEIGAIYDKPVSKKYWSGPFALPIDSPFTSPFGTKRMFNGQMQSFHQGVDLKAAIGTPIHAPSGGRVALAKDLFMTGNTVILDHGYGMFTIYAHMSKLQVKVGDEVKTGQLLGLSGMTGRASGPHLHWGAVLQKSKVNPVELTQVLE